MKGMKFMKKSKKEMQNQISAKQKVVSNKLSDHQTKDVSGGAIEDLFFIHDVYDDDGNKVASFKNYNDARKVDNCFKSRGINISGTDTMDYIRGGGINGKWGKDHGYHS